MSSSGGKDSNEKLQVINENRREVMESLPAVILAAGVPSLSCVFRSALVSLLQLAAP